jgi:hypothetical protein
VGIVVSDNDNRRASRQILVALARSFKEQGELKLAREARAAARRISSAIKINQHMSRLSATGEHHGHSQLSVMDLLQEVEASGL